jgi:large subunit ribosomal protein L6
MAGAAYSEEVEAVKDVSISLKDSTVIVKGPLGSLSKDFSHTGLRLIMEGGTLRIVCFKKGKRSKAIAGTVAKTVRSMIEGVLHGYIVKLKIVYSHFPVTVKYDKSRGLVSIHNFLGEKSPRVFKIPFENIEVQVSGQDITVTGLDKNEVAQVAAMFELATKIKDKDPRIYLDGIYVVEKGLWRKEA